HSTCMNTPITWITAPRRPLMSTPSWRRSLGARWAGASPNAADERLSRSRSTWMRGCGTPCGIDAKPDQEETPCLAPSMFPLSSSRHSAPRPLLPPIPTGAPSARRSARRVRCSRVASIAWRCRTDLKVSVDNVAIKPGLALGGWLAFAPAGNAAMVMGDLVMTEEEINPVMKKLQEGGIEVTALHNHLLRAEPATMYMHVLGHGDAVTMAGALHAALALSKTPFQVASGGTQPPAAIDLD